MAKKTAKKASKKVNPKITRAATVAAGKAMSPKKKTVAGKVKEVIKKPMLKVAKAKKTLTSKAKTAVHDAGMAAATAVGAAMGAGKAVKDLVKGK